MGLTALFEGVQGAVADKRIALPAWIQSLGLHPDDCAMIGDLPHDMDAARAASVKGLASGYGYGKPSALWTAGAEQVFEDFSSLALELEGAADQESRRSPVLTVGALILDADDQGLLVKTRKWLGKWGIPGGKVRYGESLEQAVRRELEEETGLKVEDITYACHLDCIENPQFYRPRHFLLMNYVARVDERAPKVTLNHESVDSLWLPLRVADWVGHTKAHERGENSLVQDQVNSIYGEMNSPTQNLWDLAAGKGARFWKS
jgi:ADP-ribose pyrophosphatase YjhB (NUDIX family)